MTCSDFNCAQTTWLYKQGTLGALAAPEQYDDHTEV